MDSMTLLAEARTAGIQVLADGDRLVVRGPRAAEALARRLLEHKAEVLARLQPWDPTEADALIAGLQERRRELYGESMWPAAHNGRHRLREWMDRVDAAFVAHDLAALRRLAAEFPAEPAPPVAPADEDGVARVIERDQKLPENSLQLFPPLHTCPGCTLCRWPGGGPAPRPGKDLFSVTLEIRACQRRVM
jgi:hypothetical protein